MHQTGKLKVWNILKMLFILQLDFPFIAVEGRDDQKSTNSKEIEACTLYKKQLFEIEHFYGGFTYDAEDVKYVEDNCKSYNPFVAGGAPALPKEFPPMARIGHFENGNTKWFCGGTLISVLTAAHCFYSRHGEANRVRLGELDFSRSDDDARPEDFVIKKTIDHPSFDFESPLYNDIGLIQLDRIVRFDSYKHPACLPINNGNEFLDFLAIGWGSNRFAGASIDLLQKVKLDHFSNEGCKNLSIIIGSEKLPFGVNLESQLCAGSSEAKDTCNGDSGGPLLAYHQEYPCMYYVVGITSAGLEECGQPNIPAIYTRVYHYINWIKSFIYA